MKLLDEAVGLNLVKEAVMNLLLKKIKFHEGGCGTVSPGSCGIVSPEEGWAEFPD
jgi:hypothetical protein